MKSAGNPTLSYITTSDTCAYTLVRNHFNVMCVKNDLEKRDIFNDILGHIRVKNHINVQCVVRDSALLKVYKDTLWHYIHIPLMNLL